MTRKRLLFGSSVLKIRFRVIFIYKIYISFRKNQISSFPKNQFSNLFITIKYKYKKIKDNNCKYNQKDILLFGSL